MKPHSLPRRRDRTKPHPLERPDLEHHLRANVGASRWPAAHRAGDGLMTQYLHIEGADELLRRLKQLPSKLHRNILRGALRAGAKKIKEDAERRVPVDTGFLKKTIRIRGGSNRMLLSSTVTAQVVAGSSPTMDAFYAHMVEGGTQPHLIEAYKRPLFFGGRYANSVMHPGTPPRPFMRPALEQNASEALAETGRYIEKRLDKVLR